MPRVTITPPGKNSQPYRFSLDRQAVALGRGSENDVVIDCTSVSVNHAVMERMPGGFQIRDLGSTNGTKLSGVPRETIPLLDGRKVYLGDVEFHFTLTEEEQEALAEEDNAPPAVIREESFEEMPKKHQLVSDQDREALRKDMGAFNKPMPTALFLLLALVALYLGLSIRYAGDHPGRSFLHDLTKGTPPAATTAPADEEGREAADAAAPAPEETSE
ncbi:FHA domain-containing protein [Haloferula sargassicola]|uniref:FHA domain-containing protein n=1 Tax=Haloferula sargassicola TaxID=490096 RepID=A0ABP9UQI8_9BACT